MARAADRAAIQLRVLNASKGPAVRATRAQADRALYRRAIRSMLENQPASRSSSRRSPTCSSPAPSDRRRDRDGHPLRGGARWC
jgi:hypothetical protein